MKRIIILIVLCGLLCSTVTKAQTNSINLAVAMGQKVKTLMEEGYPQKQAVAIAYSTLTKKFKDELLREKAPINFNTATKDELQLLPGIGFVISQRIVDYRSEHGAFEQIEDIRKVKGIGEKKFEKMKEWLTL